MKILNLLMLLLCSCGTTNTVYVYERVMADGSREKAKFATAGDFNAYSNNIYGVAGGVGNSSLDGKGGTMMYPQYSSISPNFVVGAAPKGIIDSKRNVIMNPPPNFLTPVVFSLPGGAQIQSNSLVHTPTIRAWSNGVQDTTRTIGAFWLGGKVVDGVKDLGNNAISTFGD